MRSGWDKDALQFGIVSPPKFFGNHEHDDRGSFILNAYGERLICDAGKPWSYGDPIIEEWFRASAGHNLLFVNGTGQTTREKLAAPGRFDDTFATDIAAIFIGSGVTTGPASDRPYAGQLKEFRIYNYALDAESVFLREVSDRCDSCLLFN